MPPATTDLSRYSNSWYRPGSLFVRAVWYILHGLFIRSGFGWNGLRIFLLRSFGARIGKGVVIKPHVTIKYPWKLHIGDHTWIGEGVWIDNLGQVTIGNHCCLSQGSMLLCGNHDYTKVTFDLIVGDIRIDDGAWIGAQTVVCPGVTVGSHAILTVGSVATKNLESFGIYQGNPASIVKERMITL